MKKLLLLICVFISAINFAQTHTWTGNGGDTNWFNSNNWDAGTVPNASSSVLINNSIVEIASNTASTSSIDLDGNSELVLDNSLMLSGIFSITENAMLTWQDGIINGGSIDNNGTIMITGADEKGFQDITVNNFEAIEINASGIIRFYGISTINNYTDGAINIDSPGGLVFENGTATVNNDGIIKNVSDGNPGAFYMIFNLNNTGTILVEEDQMFLFLVGSQNFNNTEDGFLLGYGTFDITANFTNNGRIRPGTFNNLGHLEFINNFHFPSNATIELDVFSNTEFDTISIFGSPTLEGNLVINMAGEVDLDDELTVITSSNNLTCNLPAQVSGVTTDFQYTFDVICDTNSVTLKVVEKLELLGIEDFSEEIYLVASPNPASDTVSFSYPSQVFYNDELSLEIYSILGQKMKSIPVYLETTNFNTSPLSSGLYIVNLVSEKEVLATNKLIIE